MSRTVHEETESILKTGSACYCPAQNHLSSSFLSKNIRNKIDRTLILVFVLNGFETWALTLGEVFEDRVLREIFWDQEGLGKRRMKMTT